MELTILVSILLGVGGWVAAHFFTSRRDQRNKRRDIRLERLLKCYDALAKDIIHRTVGKEQQLEFENAITELQLVGTEKLIELASNFKVNEKNKGSLIPILETLRSEIRSELGLEETQMPFMWFRFQKSGRWTKPT